MSEKFNKILCSTTGYVLLISTLFIFFNINQSSLGVWDSLLNLNSKDSRIGISRPIRSDEFLVQTPSTISIYNKNNNNTALGDPEVKDLFSLPNNDLSDLFRPKNYGYHIFGLERGFAYEWLFRTFLCFVFIVYYFSLITRGNKILSLVGGLLIYYSSFTQWWISEVGADLTSYFIFLVSSFLFLLAINPFKVFVLSFIMLVSLISLLIAGHPGFSLSLLITIPIALMTPFYGGLHRLSDCKYMKAKVVILLVMLAFVFVYMIGFVDAFHNAISLLKNTVSPGQRRNDIETMSLIQFFRGFFEFIRFTESDVPVGSNACELSSYVIILPAMYLAYIIYLGPFRYKLVDISVLFIFVFYLAIFSGLYPFSLLHSLYPLNLMRPARAFLGVGVANIVISVSIINLLMYESPLAFFEKKSLYLLISSSLIILSIGWYLHLDDPIFYNSLRICYGVIAYLIIVISLIAKSRLGILLAAFLYSAPNIIINPFQIGFGSIHDKRINSNYDTSSPLIGLDDIVTPQYFKSQNFNVINGYHIIPNVKLHNIFDPKHTYINEWNRYGYSVYHLNNHGNLSYEIVSGDVYNVDIDPCSEEVKKLGVRYVATSTKDLGFNCLHNIGRYYDTPYFIYEFNK